MDNEEKKVEELCIAALFSLANNSDDGNSVLRTQRDTHSLNLAILEAIATAVVVNTECSKCGATDSSYACA